MYTEKDMEKAKRTVLRDWLCAAPVWIACVVVFVIAVRIQNRRMAQIISGVFFAALVFPFTQFIFPHTRYQKFLRDMDRGLTRTTEGTIRAIGSECELQDGVQVFPVYVRLDNQDDERILYVAHDKLSMLPPEGSHITASCFGRHIRGIGE